MSVEARYQAARQRIFDTTIEHGAIALEKEPGVWDLGVPREPNEGDELRAKIAPKRRRIVETFYGTKTRALQRLREMQVEADRGELPLHNITLGEFLTWWLEHRVKPRKAETTYDTYRWLLAKVTPLLGSKKLDAVRPVDLDGLLNGLAREDGAGLSHASLKLCYQMLNGAFTYAVNMDLLSKHPMKPVDRPQGETPEIQPPSRLEVADILDHLKTHDPEWHPVFYLIVHTGLRSGEVLALQWNAIDLTEGRLTVREQVTNPKSGRKITKPKTKNARRVIPLSSRTVQLLEAHFMAQARLRAALGDKWSDRGLVFPNLRRTPGALEQPTALRVALKAACVALGLASYRVHDLRHYFASEALRRGVDLTRVSKLLGHSSISVTSALYIHHTETDLRAAVDMFEAGEIDANVGAMSAGAFETAFSGTEF